MKHSLAQEKLSLSVGQKYLWQIALLCNPNHPSEDLVAEAVIEVVAMPLRLTNALAQTKEIVKRADLYAEAGLWYDTLSLAVEDTKNLKEFRLQLLTKLSELEAESAKTSEDSLKKDFQEHALQLEQIVVEQQRG